MAGPTDAELMAMLRSDAERWKRRALAEGAAASKWRLLAAVLLARLPGRMTEVTVAEAGALRAEGLSIEEHDAGDGTAVVRLHKPEAEAPPGPKRGDPPTELGGTPCGTKMP